MTKKSARNPAEIVLSGQSALKLTLSTYIIFASPETAIFCRKTFLAH